jgi:hypothetical protein
VGGTRAGQANCKPVLNCLRLCDGAGSHRVALVEVGCDMLTDRCSIALHHVLLSASLPCRRLKFMKALGPLTVCVMSIALMNIFDWYADYTGIIIVTNGSEVERGTLLANGTVTPSGSVTKQKDISNIGNIPSGESAACGDVTCSHAHIHTFSLALLLLLTSISTCCSALYSHPNRHLQPCYSC